MSANDRIYITNPGVVGTLDAVPTLVTQGVDCSGFRNATCAARVTADTTSDTATMEVWLGYITSAATVKPIVVEWVQEKVQITGGNYDAIKAAASDTYSDSAKVSIDITGADRLYHRWQAQTDVAVRVRAYVKLTNPGTQPQ